MFKSGDLVILNSGGPPMAVVGTSEDGSLVTCVWMSADPLGDVHESDFLPATIKPA